MAFQPDRSRPEQSIDGMTLDGGKEYRHLSVVSEGELIGMVTLSDIVEAKVAKQHFRIR